MNLPLPRIADELNVRYALEGGVRKAGNRLRVSARLIDTQSEQHLWSEKYDGAIDDILEIQDRVSAAIADALSIVLTPEERQAMQDRRLPDAEALQLFMRAQQAVWSWNAGPLMEALTELERVLDERGDHIQILRGVAYLRWQMVNAAISNDPVHLQKMDEYVRRMEALEPGTPWAAAMTGLRQLFIDLEPSLLKLLDAYLGGIRDDTDVLGWLAWFKVILRGWSEAAAGNIQAALSALAETPEGDGGNAGALANVLRAGLEHRADDVASIVASGALAASDSDFVGAMYLADVYAIPGDRPVALHWLRRALEMGCFMPDFVG